MEELNELKENLETLDAWFRRDWRTKNPSPVLILNAPQSSESSSDPRSDAYTREKRLLRHVNCNECETFLLKYLFLMTLIEKDWGRIWMIPQIGPDTEHTKPGGFVLCQKKGASVFEESRRVELAATASIPMWPWLSLLMKKQGFRFWLNIVQGESAYHSVLAQLSAVTNDYSRTAQMFYKLFKEHLVDDFVADAATEKSDSSATDAAPDAALASGANGSLIKSAKEVCGSWPIGIVVPAYKNPEVFALCLKSIVAQDFVKDHPGNVELVVVKDWCEDGANGHEAFRKKFCEAISGFSGKSVFSWFSSHQGRSAARNLGLGKLRYAQYVFFIDSHMLLADDYISHQMAVHASCDDCGLAVLGFAQDLGAELGEEDSQAADEVRRTWVERHADYKEDWKYEHVLKPEDLPPEATAFTARGVRYEAGSTVKFMELSNWLNGMKGTQHFGMRNLPSFFQTNLVSARVEAIKRAGGFDSSLGRMWGFEDSLLGTLLVCGGVRLVPCKRSVAFKIKPHEGEGAANDAYERTHSRLSYFAALAGKWVPDRSGVYEREVKALRPRARTERLGSSKKGAGIAPRVENEPRTPSGPG